MSAAHPELPPQLPPQLPPHRPQEAPLSFLLSLALVALLPLAQAARPTCGDGAVRGGEQCDGSDLAGQTCSSLGYSGGSLACASGCTFDVSACEDSSTFCGDGLTEAYEECDGVDDAACPGACSEYCACPATTVGDLEVHMVDVGQGDGILVISPDGFAMLIDAGTESKAALIQSYMGTIGLTSLDYVLVSHMHADHVGGMDGILAAYPEVVVAFDSGSSIGTIEESEYDASAGTRRYGLTVGEFIDLGPSMTAEVLHAATGSSNENDNSNVIKLTYGNNTVLLGGDCEAACESSFDPGQVQIYKVHHHGSNTSSTQPFLDAMAPYTALISSGRGNAYAHPHQATLDALTAMDVAIYRTDTVGDIEVILDGTSYTVNGDAVCVENDSRACGDTEVGACAYGTETCTNGIWGACTGEITATTEVCDNGVDDDCDGSADLADPECTATSTWLQIVQVAYDTPGTDSVEEFVDLYNPTSVGISLVDWTLSDAAGTWTFPSTAFVPAGGFLTVARNAAGLEAWVGITPDVEGMSLSLNNAGDVLVLADDLGAEVDRVAWESYLPGWTVSAGSGDSIARTVIDVDTDTSADWSTLSPSDPFGGTPVGGGPGGPGATCGDGTCDAGEDCTSCPADCAGRTRRQAGDPLLLREWGLRERGRGHQHLPGGLRGLTGRWPLRGGRLGAPPADPPQGFTAISSVVGTCLASREGVL